MYVRMYVKCTYICWYIRNIYIQGVSRLVDITAGGDFLGLCDQKSSYKHVSDFGRMYVFCMFVCMYVYIRVCVYVLVFEYM